MLIFSKNIFFKFLDKLYLERLENIVYSNRVDIFQSSIYKSLKIFIADFIEKIFFQYDYLIESNFV